MDDDDHVGHKYVTYQVVMGVVSVFILLIVGLVMYLKKQMHPDEEIINLVQAEKTVEDKVWVTQFTYCDTANDAISGATPMGELTTSYRSDSKLEKLAREIINVHGYSDHQVHCVFCSDTLGLFVRMEFDSGTSVNARLDTTEMNYEFYSP